MGIQFQFDKCFLDRYISDWSHFHWKHITSLCDVIEKALYLCFRMSYSEHPLVWGRVKASCWFTVSLQFLRESYRQQIKELTFSKDSFALHKYFLTLDFAAFLITSSLVLNDWLSPSNQVSSSLRSSASILSSKRLTSSTMTLYISLDSEPCIKS